MALDHSLEQIPADLDKLLSDLDTGHGNAGARALAAALSLHERASAGGSSLQEAERLRRIAECCGDLTAQLQRDPRNR
jgi:hypothetical protein